MKLPRSHDSSTRSCLAIFLPLVARAASTSVTVGQTPTPTPTPTATPTPTPNPTPVPFTSHPLTFPPTTASAEVPISIGEACVSILDGPCTYMWTYGGD
ncbi:MAG: hypothetical protein M3032_08450 [Verrucomicrobiota bacterium]|nr:hypothetical protein [Verrucomicrobiota bacterium]